MYHPLYRFAQVIIVLIKLFVLRNLLLCGRFFYFYKQGCLMRYTLFTLVFCFATFHSSANGLEKRLTGDEFSKVIPYLNNSILLIDIEGSAKLFNGSTIHTPDKFDKIAYADSEFVLFFQEDNLILERTEDNKTMNFGGGFSPSKMHRVERSKKNLLFAHENDLYRIDLEDLTTKILIENNLYDSSKLICQNNCVLALGKLLLNPLNTSEVLYESPIPIDRIDTHSKHGILFLSNNLLWIYKDGEAKTMSPAQGRIPMKPIDLKSSERYLYLITEQEVHVFDWLSSSMEKVGLFTGDLRHSMTDHWGNLWLTTSTGLWNYTPDELQKESYFIIDKIVDDQSSSYSINNINLNQDANYLSIHSKLIYLPNKKEVDTEWSLDGKSWKKYDEEIIIPISMLTHGQNELLLRATIDHNQVHSIGKKIKILKSRKTSGILAWILFPLLALMSLVSLLSLRNSRKERASMKTEIEKIRAEAQLVQSEIKNDQLKMNPHFLFNALASVNGLIAQQKIPEARAAINSFSKFLREFLYSSDSNEISLESECSLLENYLNIEKICRGQSFEFEVQKIEDELLLETPIPNMVLQPFVENAIIHGVNKISYPGYIKVYFTVEDSYLVAHVEDNGVGFAKAKTKAEHKSMAINLIKKRLQNLDLGSRKEYVVYEPLNPGTRAKIYLRRI